MTATVAAPTSRWPFNRDRIVTGFACSFNSRMYVCARVSLPLVRDSVCVFFAHKQNARPN